VVWNYGAIKEVKKGQKGEKKAEVYVLHARVYVCVCVIWKYGAM
jgi:hypothetical protein